MQMQASSFFSPETDSLEAGQAAGAALREHFGQGSPHAVMVYATMNHDQALVLEGLHSTLGPNVRVLGCSVQGVVTDNHVTEEGFALAVMGFGGSALGCAVAEGRDIQVQSREKGEALAKKLVRDLGAKPKMVILLYDPLCGADVEAMVAGMRSDLDCPIVGGGAGQPWGPPVQTLQFMGEEVFSNGVVALALSGPFSAEIGICHGTAPIGINSTVTKAVGNQVTEIDGRSAMDVWRETTGCEESDMVHQSHLASWALGIERRYKANGPNGATDEVTRVIRGAFGFNKENGSIVLQAAIPEGSRVMLHHRTIEDVLSGTETMAGQLAKQLQGRTPWAVLGFECAARTYPFLGTENTLKEHLQLRGAVAPLVPWLGMMAWGEIGPCGGETAFHNYTYPLVVLTDERAA